MQINITPKAQQHINSIYDYILTNTNATIAKKTLKSIEQSILNLERFSSLGKKISKSNIRKLVVPNLPFIIIYKATSNAISILAVTHTSRIKW